MSSKFRVAIALSGLLALMAMSGSASGAPALINAYNSTPTHLTANVPSVGFEASATSEFGDEVTLVGAGTHLRRVKVVMSSWGCETGSWNNNNCLTSPGASFSVPITVNVYVGTNGGAPGALLASQTRTFNIKFRPSRNTTKCTGPFAGEWWSKADHSCYNGFAQVITFSFPGSPGINLPNDVVWTVAYNTTHYGYVPVTESAPCFTSSGGCGYDSLNVGVETFPGQPNHGTDVDPNGVYFNSSVAGVYCDGGTGGVGILRLDSDPGPCGWGLYKPLATIKTST